MVIMTRWDAFHDLRGAQDQMNEIHKLVAQLRGQQAAQLAPVRPVPRPGRRRSTSPNARMPTL